MVSYIKGIICIVLTIYIALIYGSVSILMFAIAQTIILVLSFLCLFFGRGKIEVKVEVPIPISEKGKAVYIVIRLNNKNKWSMTKVKIHQSYNKKKRWLHISNVIDGSNEARIKLSFNSTGRHDVMIDKVKIYDAFGLYNITRKIDKQATFLILPEIKSYEIRLGEGIRNFEGDADIYDELRAGNDPTETFQIREYRPGDKVQSIHWKLSAKSEEIYVRENGFPKACPVVILLDNADIETVASLSYSLVDKGCPHFCSWMTVSTGEMIRGRVDDEESFYLMLLSYMQDGVSERMENLKSLYEQKYHENNYLHWITIDKDIKIDGEKCSNEEVIL